MAKRSENGAFALPPSVASNGYNDVTTENGQHAGLVLSPSKKCKVCAPR